MPAVKAGGRAPDFTLPTMAGQKFSLAQALQRGPVVLAFFKVSCPVCQYAFPFLERLHQGYIDKPAAVIGVSQNGRQDTAAFQREYGITFPVALDDTGKYPVSNAYGLTNVPTVFLISPDGSIEVSSVGWARTEFAEINARVAATLQASQAPVFRAGEEVADWKAG
jgi:peroxiredoxin